MKQRHRIRPAGNGDQHAISGGQQLVLFNRSLDLFVKQHCRKTLWKSVLGLHGQIKPDGRFRMGEKKLERSEAAVCNPAQADWHYLPSPTNINGGQK
jgi:hypothetical protein